MYSKRSELRMVLLSFLNWEKSRLSEKALCSEVQRQKKTGFLLQMHVFNVESAKIFVRKSVLQSIKSIRNIACIVDYVQKNAL